eukprot:1156479-Pelagomonas_calceolata.AAC.2
MHNAATASLPVQIHGAVVLATLSAGISVPAPNLLLMVMSTLAGPAHGVAWNHKTWHVPGHTIGNARACAELEDGAANGQPAGIKTSAEVRNTFADDERLLNGGLPCPSIVELVFDHVL